MRDEKHDPDYASLAARALAANQPSTVPPPVEDRAATIAAIERALRARTRRRLHPWWLLPVVGAALAAAAVLLVTDGRGGRGGRDTNHPGFPTTIANLSAGTKMSGPSSIEIASGTRLHLAAHSTAKVLELGTVQKFLLESGSLRAEVAKLTAGRRFLIETPDVVIEVKGTRFDVAVTPVAASDCGPSTRTRVTVHEGVVAVRFAGKEVRLGPGADWPNCAASDPVESAGPARFTNAQVVQTTRATSQAHTVAASPNAPRSYRERSPMEALAVVGPRTTTVGATSSTRDPSRSPSARSPSSTLADQNDMLAAALSARHRGDVAEALRWLDRLLSRYPEGQLVDSARAERRRLLESGAPSGERASE